MLEKHGWVKQSFVLFEFQSEWVSIKYKTTQMTMWEKYYGQILSDMGMDVPTPASGVEKGISATPLNDCEI